MEAAVRRGNYGFRLTPGGLLQGCPDNVELLRRLWIGSREGGKVWEHWCTLRDLRPDESTSQSVLGAYVTLVGLLGELFVAFVGRGRRDYYHPEQLAALVSAGFLSESAANTLTTPRPVPSDAESLLQQAQPAAGLAAAGLLDWGGLPRYYMFSRRIERWNANPIET